MVQVEGVTLAYRRLGRAPKVAVSDFSLHIAAGEIHALLGPNRAGKTTVVRALVGLLQPQAGVVRVAGFDPVMQRRRVAACTGVVLDGGRVLPPRWTGHEAVVFAGVMCGLSSAEANLRSRALLDRFGLTDASGELVNKYSRGMRQRLYLAMAFVHDPHLLILDEPTLALDAESARELRRYLAGIRREGRTVLLTTHEMSLVEALADRVTVLSAGEAVASGPVSDVVSALGATRRVHIVMSAVPVSVQRLPGVEVDGHTVHAPLDSAVLARLFKMLEEAGRDVATIVSDSGLDEVVASLGGRGA